jgi:hypothetical protein
MPGRSRRGVGRAADAHVAQAHALEQRAYFAISFNDPATYPLAGKALTQPALADFNGDGFLDVATASTTSGMNTISVLLNKGDGTFNAQTPLDAGGRPFQVIAGDFNKDDKQDLACTNTGDGTVSVFLGKGDGTFESRLNSTYGTGGAPQNNGTPAPAGDYLAADDLDGDGVLDLVVSDQADDQIVTLLGGGGGRFDRHDDVTFIARSPAQIALADFTGDGQLDVATTLTNSSALQVYFTDGNGNLDDGHAFTADGVTKDSITLGLTTGDFDGDGKPDVAMVSYPPTAVTHGTLTIFPGTGSPIGLATFGTTRNTSLALAATDVSAADLDGDGQLDVVVSQTDSGFQVFRSRESGSSPLPAPAGGSSSGSFSFTSVVTNSNFDVSGAAAVGDLNKDGTPDLAFAHSTSSADTLAVFLANPQGGTGGPTTVTPTLQATLPPAVVAGGKASGAKVSVVVTNSGTGTLNAPVTFDLFASTDAALDEAADTAVGSPVTKKLKLNPGASKTVKLKVTTIPSVSEGDYFLIARTSATGSTGGADVSDTAVHIAPPFIDLTGAFGSPLPSTLARGKKATVPVTVTNSGNVNVSASLTVALAARPSAGGADVPIPTNPVKVNLKPGASKTLKLKITTPDALPAGGVFNYVATIDSTNAVAEKDETNNDALSSSTFTVS